MVLQLRDLRVTVASVEERKSSRALLVESAGARYVNIPDSKADIVIEAAGSPAAAQTGLDALAPAGVLVVLGADRLPGTLSLINLIVKNQVVAGSVNAGPQAFAEAVRDRPRVPQDVLARMMLHMSFGDYRRSMLGDLPEEPKLVHHID
jgi:threonine dehydrogenase-like Zn-dependent dehydrogenase